MERRVYSRRKVLLGTAFAGVSLIGADRILKDGLILRSPDLTPVPKRINVNLRGVDLTHDIAIDLETGFKPLRINDRTSVYYNTDDDLIFQHDDARIDPKRWYKYSHRSGNRKFMVDKAITLGANYFDIDVSSLSGGEIVAGHGIVKKVEVGPLTAGGVIDVNEVKVRTRIPKTAPEMFDYIASRSNPEDPYVVAVELKGGSFSEKKGLNNFIAGITRNGLPTWVFSSNQDSVDNLYNACEDYARSYGPTA